MQFGVSVPLSGLVLGFFVFSGAIALLPTPWRSRMAATLACVSAAVALAATLVRPQGGFPPAGWWPWEVWQVSSLGPVWPDEPRAQLNLLLLLPFAWFATLVLGRPLLAAAGSVLLTCVVEYVQGAAGLGTPQLADLVHNSVGAAVGAAAAHLLLAAVDRVSVGRRYR